MDLSHKSTAYKLGWQHGFQSELRDEDRQCPHDIEENWSKFVEYQQGRMDHARFSIFIQGWQNGYYHNGEEYNLYGDDTTYLDAIALGQQHRGANLAENESALNLAETDFWQWLATYNAD